MYAPIQATSNPPATEYARPRRQCPTGYPCSSCSSCSNYNSNCNNCNGYGKTTTYNIPLSGRDFVVRNVVLDLSGSGQQNQCLCSVPPGAESYAASTSESTTFDYGTIVCTTTTTFTKGDDTYSEVYVETYTDDDEAYADVEQEVEDE